MVRMKVGAREGAGNQVECPRGHPPLASWSNRNEKGPRRIGERRALDERALEGVV
jgi:hypothetical protein